MHWLDLPNEVIILVLEYCNNNTLLIVKNINYKLRDLVSFSYGKIYVGEINTGYIHNVQYARCVKGNQSWSFNYLTCRIKYADCVIINGDITFLDRIDNFNKIHIETCNNEDLYNLIQYNKPISFMYMNKIDPYNLSLCYNLLENDIIYRSKKTNELFIEHKRLIYSISLFQYDVIEYSSGFSLTRDSLTRDPTYYIYDLPYRVTRVINGNICVTTKSYVTNNDLYLDQYNNIYQCSIDGIANMCEYKKYTKTVNITNCSYKEILDMEFYNVELIKITIDDIDTNFIKTLFTKNKSLERIKINRESKNLNDLIPNRYDIIKRGNIYYLYKPLHEHRK